MAALSLRNRRAIFPAIAGIAALLLASFAQADVFRCEDGGRVVYSDRPCATKVTVMKIATVAPVSASAAAADTRAADKADRIVVGMTSVQVLRIEGMPVEKTREKNSQSLRETWVYCRDDAYTDVELLDGVVVKVSRRTASARAGSASLAAAAGTTRNEVSASQNTTPVESRKTPDGVQPVSVGTLSTTR